MKNLRDTDACLFLEKRVATIRYFIFIKLSITPVNIRVYIYINKNTTLHRRYPHIELLGFGEQKSQEQVYNLRHKHLFRHIAFHKNN